MGGFQRIHRKREHGKAFPASRYDDPRGGRLCGIEADVLRYRACEAALYLWYAETTKKWLIQNLGPYASRAGFSSEWASDQDQRLRSIQLQLIAEAKGRGAISAADAQTLEGIWRDPRKQSRVLRTVMAYARSIGFFTSEESRDLKKLLDYRNAIAHRIDLITLDVSKDEFVSGGLAFQRNAYSPGALDKLRAYWESLYERARPSHLLLSLSFDDVLFEHAKRFYEAELRRLHGRIERSVSLEQDRYRSLRDELDLDRTGLTGDLDPRFPFNFRQRQSWCDEYKPPTGHLTKRGAEICYRLFDAGKSPLAVAYLMGMTLRSAERRLQSWKAAGGKDRVRGSVQRYDPRTWRRITDTAADQCLPVRLENEVAVTEE